MKFILKGYLKYLAQAHIDKHKYQFKNEGKIDNAIVAQNIVK